VYASVPEAVKDAIQSRLDAPRRGTLVYRLLNPLGFAAVQLAVLIKARAKRRYLNHNKKESGKRTRFSVIMNNTRIPFQLLFKSPNPACFNMPWSEKSTCLKRNSTFDATP
jgi:hypothetical protein